MQLYMHIPLVRLALYGWEEEMRSLLIHSLAINLTHYVCRKKRWVVPFKLAFKQERETEREGGRGGGRKIQLLIELHLRIFLISETTANSVRPLQNLQAYPNTSQKALLQGNGQCWYTGALPSYQIHLGIQR